MMKAATYGGISLYGPGKLSAPFSPTLSSVTLVEEKIQCDTCEGYQCSAHADAVCPA